MLDLQDLRWGQGRDGDMAPRTRARTFPIAAHTPEERVDYYIFIYFRKTANILIFSYGCVMHTIS